MKSRKDVALFIEEQLNSGCKVRQKPSTHHYGKQELRELLDFIYESEPSNFEECILSDRGSYRTSESGCKAKEEDKIKINNLTDGSECSIAYHNGTSYAYVTMENGDLRLYKDDSRGRVLYSVFSVSNVLNLVEIAYSWIPN